MNELLERLRKRIITQENVVSSPIWNGVIYPPNSVAAVESAQTKLGFCLPELLYNIYTQVANGDIGPGYGIFGIEGGAPAWVGTPPDHELPDLVGYYFLTGAREPQDGLEYYHFGGRWPEKLLPICDWGC